MTPIEMRVFAVLGILVTAVLAVVVAKVTDAAIQAVRTSIARIQAPRRVDAARAASHRPTARRLPC